MQRIQHGARTGEWIGFREGIREPAQGRRVVLQLRCEGDEDASAAAVFLKARLGEAPLGFECGAGGDGCHLGPLGFLEGGAAGSKHGGDQFAMGEHSGLRAEDFMDEVPQTGDGGKTFAAFARLGDALAHALACDAESRG